MHFGEYELFPSLIGLSPLPTGHPKTFQRQRVRASTMCYHSFTLPMGRSHGFASTTTDYGALLRLAFAAAPPLKGLTLPVKVTRRLIMQKARRHGASTAPTACRRMVSGSLSLRYSRFFSPFPHGTGSLSVSQEYLVLADGPAGFTQGFTCPALLRIPLSQSSLPVPGYHRLRPLFPKGSSSSLLEYRGPTTPHMPEHVRFGLIRFRSPLLPESLLFSPPPAT